MEFYRVSRNEDGFDIITEHVTPGSARFMWLKDNYELYSSREDAERYVEDVIARESADEVARFNGTYGTTVSEHDYFIIKNLLK